MSLIKWMLILFSLLIFSCGVPPSSPVAKRANPPGHESPEKPSATLPPLSEAIQKSTVEYSNYPDLKFIDSQCIEESCVLKAINSAKQEVSFSTTSFFINIFKNLNMKKDDLLSVIYQKITNGKITTYVLVGFQFNSLVHYLSNIRSLTDTSNEVTLLEAHIAEFYISDIGVDTEDKIQIVVTGNTNKPQTINFSKSLLLTLIDRDPYLEKRIKFFILYNQSNIIGFSIRNNKSMVF